MRAFIIVGLVIGAISQSVLADYTHDRKGTTLKPHPQKEVSLETQQTASAPVNINQADANMLTTLKGIGKKRADAIIAYRNTHGPFSTIDELAKVKGIGKKGLGLLQQKNPGRLMVGSKK